LPFFHRCGKLVLSFYYNTLTINNNTIKTNLCTVYGKEVDHVKAKVMISKIRNPLQGKNRKKLIELDTEHVMWFIFQAF